MSMKRKNGGRERKEKRRDGRLREGWKNGGKKKRKDGR